jgi:hypothetical protein
VVKVSAFVATLRVEIALSTTMKESSAWQDTLHNTILFWLLFMMILLHECCYNCCLLWYQERKNVWLKISQNKFST